MTDYHINKQKNYSFCLSSHLYNSLQNSCDRTLVLDMRDNETFKKCHTYGSLNIDYDYLEPHSPSQENSHSLKVSDLIVQLKGEDAVKFAKRRRCFCFIVFGQNSLPQKILNQIKTIAQSDAHENCFQVVDEQMQELMTPEDPDEECSNEDLLQMAHALDVFRTLHEDKVRELFIVIDGFATFFSRYSYMTTSHLEMEPSLVEKEPAKAFVKTEKLPICPVSVRDFDFPHDILEGRLFLGSFNQAKRDCMINKLGITHVLNITYECENVHEDKGIKYLKVSILDESDKHIYLHFKEVYDFLNEALESNDRHKVLVHCAMGKSRSATMVIMFLMKKYSWSYDKAYDHVKKRRELIEPNDGFVQQLQDFGKRSHAFTELL